MTNETTICERPASPAAATLLQEPLPESFAIETPRLRLRPPRDSDLDELFAVIEASLPQLSRWLPWCQNGCTRDATGQWIRTAIDSWRATREFAFLIADRGSGEILGATGLNRIDVPGRWANLGYWLRSNAAGNGLASEAATAVAQFGFRELRLWRIEIVADAENHASRRVAEKIGAKFECIARNRASIGDRRRDAAVYSLIREA